MDWLNNRNKHINKRKTIYGTTFPLKLKLIIDWALISIKLFQSRDSLRFSFGREMTGNPWKNFLVKISYNVLQMKAKLQSAHRSAVCENGWWKGIRNWSRFVFSHCVNFTLIVMLSVCPFKKQKYRLVQTWLQIIDPIRSFLI